VDQRFRFWFSPRTKLTEECELIVEDTKTGKEVVAYDWTENGCYKCALMQILEELAAPKRGFRQ